MKNHVLVVTLLACLPIGKSQVFPLNLRFQEGAYNAQEGAALVDIRLTSNLGVFPRNFTGFIEVDVVATSDEAGKDFLLMQNGAVVQTATVVFTQRNALSSSFQLNATCDNVVEGDETFTLIVSNFSIPTDAPYSGNNGSTTTVEITDCESDEIECRFDVDGDTALLTVTEGINSTVSLTANCTGLYTTNFTIGVGCARNTDNPAETPSDWILHEPSDFSFSTHEMSVTFSDNTIDITIIDDNETEGQQEVFVCFLETTDLRLLQVTAGDPNRVTIEILDNDVLSVSWDQDFYQYNESDVNATTTLNTSSNFPSSVNVPGRPRMVSAISALQLPPGVTGNPIIIITTFRGQQYGVVDLDFGDKRDMEIAVTAFEFNQADLQSSQSFIIIDDDILEFDELVMADFSTDTLELNVRKAEPSVTYILIKDDDTVEACFVEDRCTVNETVGTAIITLRIKRKFFIPVSATVSCTPGTATADDFRFDETTVYFPLAGRALDAPDTTDIFLSIEIVDDAMFEEEECFTCTITNTSMPQKVLIGSPSTKTICIVDPAVTCRFSPQNYTTAEGMPADLMIVCDQPPTENITLTVTTMDDTAQSPEDYQGGTYEVIIPANEMKGTLPVPTELDSVTEGTESFRAILSPPPNVDNVTIGSPSVAYVNITDETVPVKFNPATYSVTEGVDSFAVITLMACAPHDFAFNVDVVTRGGTATDGEDYSGGRINVTFPAGEPTVTFIVPITDDEVAECPEEFFLDLEIPPDAADMGVIKVSPDVATVNIADEDIVTVSFSPQNYTVPEGTPAELMIVLDRESVKNLTCNLVTMDITAISPDDYTGGTIPFTIPAGMTKVTLPVPTNRDTVCDGDETFRATINCDQTPINIEIGSNSFVTILDTTVPVQFNPTVYTVTEGDNAVVTVTLEALKDHEFPFNVTVNIMDGTAGSGSDYGGPQMITVMFLAGENRVNFTISIVNNDIAECPEDFSLQLVIPQSAADMGVVTKSDNTAMVNIMDEDVVTISFSPQNYTVPEGTPAELMIVLDRESAKDITCNLVTMDITAISPDDYTGGTIPFTIPAGMTKVTLPVPTNRDTVCDGDETFKTNISCDQTPLNMEIGPDSCVTITDATVPVQFNPTVYTVTEGDSAVVTVTLEALKDHEFPFNVTVNTMDGTAGSGSDYGGPQMITVMFPAQQNSVDFTIPIVNNEIAECLEDFFLQLVIPQSAADMGIVTKSNDTAVVTILDDDVLIISLTSTDYTVKENEGPVNIMISASRQAEFPYIVTLRTEPSVDGLAMENEDYLPGPFNISFSPGTTVRSQPITIVDDNIAEKVESIAPCVYNSMESFLVRISILQESVEKGVQVDTPEARVTIMDNDVVISFADASYVTDEDNEGGIPITIVGCGDVSTGFTIPLTVTGGTATEGVDYMHLPGSVEFPAQAVEFPSQEYYYNVSFQFVPICDNITEDDEGAELEISVPMTEQHRVVIGNRLNTTVMITERCPTQDKCVNDTVMADPVFTVPINTQNTSGLPECFPMCYEVHGRNGTFFNFISDNCASVNAYYIEAIIREAGNVIREIGVVASDNTSNCHYVQVTVNDDGACLTQVDGQALDFGMTLINDITVYHTSSLVRISVPNCSQRKHLAMWVRCERLTLKVHSNQVPITFEQPLIKYVVSRGLRDRPLAHGLIGQFWGVPFDVVPLPDGNYSLTVMPLHPDVPSRTIYASMGHFTWTLNHVAALPGRCFYVGTSQAGPWPEGYDSVIQGNYEEYIVHDGLFSTIWTYSQYTAATCGN